MVITILIGQDALLYFCSLYSRSLHEAVLEAITFIVKVKLFHSESDKLHLMKFYHPPPPLFKATVDMDMNKGLEPELYFVILHNQVKKKYIGLCNK